MAALASSAAAARNVFFRRASAANARQRRRAMPVVAAAADKPILYDVQVSNNGARCRLIMYWKRLEDAVEIRDPGTIGGLKSEEYLALNPQGKMPLLVLPDGLALPESEVISRYLCDAHADVGPSLLPAESPERRAVCALATRVHDQYVVPIQGVMYRGPMPIEQRAEGIAAIAKQLDAKQLDVIEVQCIVKQLLLGIIYLRQKKIIHRDLKLGNLLVSKDMEVKICDFGLSVQLDSFD